MTPYHGRKPRDGRRENKSGWTGPQPAVTGGKRQPPAPDCGAHVGEVIDQVSDAARHQDTADSDGLSAGVVALPKMAGRTNLGALGRAVYSSRAGVKPAALMESSVGRLQSQHTTIRLSQFIRSCSRAVPVSSAR